MHHTEEQPSCISDPAGLQAGRGGSEFDFEASLWGFQTVLGEEIAASSCSHMVKLSSIRHKPRLLFTSNFTTQEEGDRSMIEGKAERGGGKYVVLKLSFYSPLFPHKNWWISYQFSASLQPLHAAVWEGLKGRFEPQMAAFQQEGGHGKMPKSTRDNKLSDEIICLETQ